MGIIDVALSQRDIKEVELNQIEYNKWYYNRNVSGGQYPYCAVFVSWCAERAKIPTDIIPKTASVKSLYEFFTKNNLFHHISDKYSPNPGDLMIQRSNGSSHVGIVLDSDPLGFTTIEGNSGKGVETIRHSFTEPEITGFAAPNYSPGMIFSVQRFADSGKLSEQEIWNWLKGKGYNDSATAAILGKLKQANTQYNPAWYSISSGSTLKIGMGIFGWTWDYVAADDNYPIDDDAKMSQKRANHPNSQITNYLNWCDSKGYSHTSTQSQLEYFFETKSGDLAPESLNAKTVEQASQTVGQSLENSTANDASIANELYSKYSGKTPDEVSSTPDDAAVEKGVRDKGYTQTVNLGIYEWTDVTVKEGDTIDSLAKKYNTTPQLILWANNLNTWEIKPGDVLQIPTPKTALSQTEAVSGTNPLSQLTHTKKIEVSHPTAYVMFFGEYGKLAATSVSDKVLNDDYVDYDIISISTNRSLSQDCPTFSISLVWRNKWYENLASNDMVVIQLQRPPEKLATVFYGLVDDVRKSMDFSSGQPQRSVTVTGRGFNKAFCQFDIGALRNYADNTTANGGFFAGLMELRGRGSAYNIQLVFDAYLDKGLRYKFSNGKTLKDYIGYTGENYPNEKLINSQSYMSFNGNIWNFIKQLTNSPFNETFWEIKNGLPWLTHRPTPFEKEDWTKLNRITIKDHDLVADNTGRSDTETYSAFQTDLTVGDQGAINSFPPAYYPPFYEKYGIRMLKVSSMYAITAGDVSVAANLDPKMFTQQLANFNIKNNVMENGTLTVKGSNQYKIGERVILESSNMEYYVEGVSQSFNMYSTWTTSLSVTRGLHPEDRFTPPWNSCIDLTNDIYAGILKLTQGKNPDWRSAKEGGTPATNAVPTGTEGSVTDIKISGAGSGLDDMKKANLSFLSDPVKRSSTSEIIFHHPYADPASVEDVHAIHLKRTDGGQWIGIGYNLYIRKDGSLWEGRGLEMIGAHTQGFNSHSIGISLEGKFDKGVAPTQAQLDTAAKVVAEIGIKYGLTLNRTTVTGHMEHSGHEKTGCPGTLLTDGYIDSIVETANQLKQNAQVTREPVTQNNPQVPGQYTYSGLQFVHPSPYAKYITSPFGARNAPTAGASSFHKGIDLACAGGAEGKPIVAACAGKVIWAGAASGYGNLIEILHANGISTRYGHMWDTGIFVKVGDTVVMGQKIATIGAAGIGTGAHLHFELRIGVGESMSQQGEAIDPQANLGIVSEG